MLENTILKLLGVSENKNNICELVSKLIEITKEDNIDFWYLDSLVCKIQEHSNLSKADIFKKFVQYPYYEVYNKYIEILNKLSEKGDCYFICGFEEGVYEYDCYVSDTQSLEAYIEQSIRFSGKVSVSRLVSMLSIINIQRKEFSLIDLAKQLVRESDYKHIEMLNYLEDVYDNLSINGGNIDNYYLVCKEFTYGIEVVGDR